MDGWNWNKATVFAYGQTSSGKTYTMTGTNEQPGVIPLAINDIYKSSRESKQKEYILRASYIEIYNETINDLFDKNGKNLKIRGDDVSTIFIYLFIYVVKLLSFINFFHHNHLNSQSY